MDASHDLANTDAFTDFEKQLINSNSNSNFTDINADNNEVSVCLQYIHTYIYTFIYTFDISIQFRIANNVSMTY